MPVKFFHQSSHPVPDYCPPSLFSYCNTKFFLPMLIPVNEQQKVGCFRAFIPPDTPEIPLVQSFIFRKSICHETQVSVVMRMGRVRRYHTVSCFLPLARLRLITSLPDAVLILTRKPWVLFLLLLCGWYVLFILYHPDQVWNYY